MQLALWILPHTTLKLDSEVVHTDPVVLWKCTSIVSGGQCATMSSNSTQMLLTLHAASLDTPTLLTWMLWLTRKFSSVSVLYIVICHWTLWCWLTCSSPHDLYPKRRLCASYYVPLSWCTLASFPGSCAWVEKKEPSTHGLCMLSSPRISGNFGNFRKACPLH